jgi:hypothetical protein
MLFVLLLRPLSLILKRTVLLNSCLPITINGRYIVEPTPTIPNSFYLFLTFNDFFKIVPIHSFFDVLPDRHITLSVILTFHLLTRRTRLYKYIISCS